MRNALFNLLEEKKFLEENGIDIITSKGLKHFALGLIIGDNLAMNNILGFGSSFNQAYYCRFCKYDKRSCSTLTTIENDYIRNINNYTSDVKENDILKGGIRENCIFNSLKTFHVTENYSVDAMHEFFEGVCRYNMPNVINNFIAKNTSH
ncbi:hypothetical protein CVS40_6556 [Lucilia cuprina]|nr:hypothetical protein CVS40_6556 [Lucilia cuprina]